MRISFSVRTLLATASVACLSAVAPAWSPASAGPLPESGGSNCIVNVTGVDSNDNLVTSTPTCYSTFADVLRSRGQSVSDSATPQTTPREQMRLSGIIATHYDGAGWSGSSFSVSGTTCTGGGLNLPLSWNDRISSTQSGICTTIVHFENTNYAGATFTTTGSGGDITGYMDNRTSSIKYFA